MLHTVLTNAPEVVKWHNENLHLKLLVVKCPSLVHTLWTTVLNLFCNPTGHRTYQDILLISRQFPLTLHLPQLQFRVQGQQFTRNNKPPCEQFTQILTDLSKMAKLLY